MIIVACPLSFPKFPPLHFPALRGTPTTSFLSHPIPGSFFIFGSFSLPLPLPLSHQLRPGFIFTPFSPLAIQNHISVSTRSFFARFLLVSRFLEPPSDPAILPFLALLAACPCSLGRPYSSLHAHYPMIRSRFA